MGQREKKISEHFIPIANPVITIRLFYLLNQVNEVVLGIGFSKVRSGLDEFRIIWREFVVNNGQ